MTAPKPMKAPKIKFLQKEDAESVASQLLGRVSFNSHIGLVGRSVEVYHKGYTFYTFSDDVDYMLYSENKPYAWHSKFSQKWFLSQEAQEFAEDERGVFLKTVMKRVKG